MSNRELSARLDFTLFSPGQRASLANAQQRIAPLLSDALDRFYATAEKTAETRAFFSDRAHMQKAKSAQEAHWRSLASGRFDDGYYESVRRIGNTHARIGLEPRWYIGAYAIVLEGLIRGLSNDASKGRGVLSRFGSEGRDLEAIIAVIKAALIDMDLSISMYFEQSQAERDKAMAELTSREEELSKLLATIGGTAETVLTGAQEIAQASEDLARRTESNAASLEETAAAVTQMDGRLKETAVAASQTVARADQTKETVSSGREVADEAVRAMSRVSDSAKGIDSVIEGLDKIAFQTRVLAMNAAVEAGRAGEAGRGFAVVADLVSALAMRAEEEAKRARDQLTVTQADVVTAVAAVEKVDGALQAISGDVEQVHQLLATIAAENAAQASAISEINAAVASMDRATQQNAAMVEETSAAARNLTQEVNALADQASQFLVDDARPAVTRPRGKNALAAAPAKSAAPTRSAGSSGNPCRSLGKLLTEANAKVLTNGAAHDDWNAF